MYKNYISLSSSTGTTLKNNWMKRAFIAVLFMMFSVMSVKAQVTVAATTGTATANYTTLGAAFAAINAGTHTGAITISITANSTETAACVLNSSGAGSASYTSINLRPTTDGVTISGPTVTGRGLIELNGADNVTIDGDNPNTSGTNRNLTITNTAATTVTYTSVIRIALSTLISTADNNTVKNCIINGSAAAQITSANTSATTGSVGSSNGILVSGGASTTTATTAPSAIASNTTTTGTTTALNFTATNNQISACGRGICVSGSAVTVVPVLTITNNVIGNATAGATTGVAWKGISAQGFSTGSVISGNTVYVESWVSTSPYPTGIELGGVSAVGTGIVVEKNTIGRVYQNNTGGWGSYGINVVAGNANTVQNNFVNNVKNIGSGSFSTSFGAYGIRIGAGLNHKVYHNTVSMTGSDSGTGNLQACFGITANTLTGIDVRNNIFSNTMTSSSTTSAFVCMFLPSGSTSSMNLTLNNNAYYTGATAGLHGIAHGGTTYTSTVTTSGTGLYTAANFNPAVTTSTINLRNYTSTLLAANTNNDNASFATSTTAAPFTSSSDLHINSAATGANSLAGTGASGTGVTTDFDGATRTTAPDIGADEFAVVPGCASTPSPADDPTFTVGGVSQAPTLSWAATSGATSYDVYLNGSIVSTSQTATSYVPGALTASTNYTWKVVPKSAKGSATGCSTWSFKTVAAVPTLNAGSLTAFSSTCTGATSAANSFTITAINLTSDITLAALSGFSYCATVGGSYTSTLTITPSSGSISTTVYVKFSPSTATAYSGNIVISGGGLASSVNVAASGTGVNAFGGTYAVGAGQTYTTLTAAVAAYNSATCFSGNVVFNLMDSTYSGSETFPITINSNANSGTYTLKIKPNTTATITGSVASGALIKLNGAKYVTIDGSSSGGTDKSLTITNSNTTAPTVVAFASLGTSLGTTNSTVKNCNLSTGVATSTGYGVAIGGATPGSAGSDNDTNTVQNNTITGATVGVYAVGNASVSATGMDTLTVTGNTITTNTTIGTLGIQVGNTLSSTISQNTISVTTTSTSSPVGISLETGFVTSSVSRNTITAAVTSATGGYAGRGITVGTGTASSNITIDNNIIYGVNGSNWSSFGNASSMGICIGEIGAGTGLANTTGGIKLYYNSINMIGSMGSGSTAAITTALYVASTATGLDVRNNIFSNTQVATSTTQKNYAIYSAAANTAFTTINYNDYFVSNTFNAASAIPGFIGSDRTNLAGIVTGFGQNANSISTDPLFTATSSTITNALWPGTGSPVIAAGTAVAVTNDYLGATRNATPSIGAYESVTPTCAAPASPTALVQGTTGPGSIAESFTPNATAPYGYMVVRYLAGATVTAPVNGTTTYAAGQALGLGTITNIVAGSGSTFSLTGLSPSTSYDIYVYPYSMLNCVGGPAFGTPLTGTHTTSGCPSIPTSITVGATGADYTTLTDLALILNGCPVSNPVLVQLQSNYAPASETLPIVFNNNTGTSATNTITIRPATGAGPFGINGSSTSALLDLSGARYFTFDGRAGGTGASVLSITNSGNGAALRLFNDAQNNTIQYLALKASNASATNGVVRITSAVSGGTALTNGNNNNTITYCTIDGNGVSPNGIYAAGTAAPADNKSNTISNNSIFNYFSDVASTNNYGILLGGNNGVSASSAWTITGNSFYQTATRTYTTTSGIVAAIGGGYTPAGAFNITNNYFGGSAATASGTMTIAGATGTQNVAAINLIYGGADNSSITGNTVTNMNITTNSTSTFQGLIVASSIGTSSIAINNNTIGSISNPTSISYTGGAAAVLSGISAGAFYATQTGASVTIDNNTIAGISLPGTTNANTFRGIYIGSNLTATASSTITNNTIGNTAAAISNASPASIIAIQNDNNIGATISTNTITKLTATNAGTAVSVMGINAANVSGSMTINSNTITTLTSAAANIATTTGVAIVGIQSIAPASSFSNNTINSLTASANAAVTIHGIYNSGTAAAVNANKIYDLSASNAGATSAVLNGIYANGGTSIYSNNSVRLGTVNPTIANSINGIYDITGTNSYYFNSVYIGGSGVGTITTKTYAFRSSNTGTRTIQNNIFMNARSNATTGGSHYAITVAGTAASPTGLSLNNNDYFANGTNGVLGLFNSTDVTTLATWKTNTGLDSSSFNSNPNFNGATSTTPDLSINASIASVLESSAVTISGITLDQSGVTRNASTPDMGALEFSGTSAVPTIVTATSTGSACTPTSHDVTATITAGGTTLTAGMVKLSYAFNGGTATLIDMTNTTGTTWTATIPLASPTTATVTWFVKVDDGSYVVTKNGTSYADDPMSSIPISITTSAATVCSGTTVSLNAVAQSVNLGPTGLPAAYCAATNSGGAVINSISFNGLSTSGAQTTPYYTLVDPSTTTTSLIRGQTYTFSMTSLPDATYSTSIASVWIDYNRNGSFEATEWQQVWTSAASGSISITIPLTATVGDVGMRVRSRGNGNANGSGDSCTAMGSGSTQDFTVTIKDLVDYSSQLTYAWSDGTGSAGTGTTITPTPSATTTYTLTATQTSSSCTKTATQLITVLPLPTAPTGTNGGHCGSATPTCSVASAAGASGSGVFTWYTTATGGTAITGQSGASLSGFPIGTVGTVDFYVSEVGTNGCESPRTHITETITAPTAITLGATPSTNLCSGTSFAPTVSSANTNYTYLWTAIPATGSGITTSIAGATPTITPTVAGSYTYTVTATDASGFPVCTATQSFSVTILNCPIPIATTTIPTACGTATPTIGFTYSSALPATYAATTAVTNPTTDEDFGGIVITTTGGATVLNNATTVNSLVGTIGTATGTVGSYSNFTAFGPYSITAGQTYNIATSSVQTGGTFTNIMAVWIDYNRNGDFSDAGELVYTSTATAGEYTGTGTFTVPATAFNGVTRMRVLDYEGSSITGPTQTVGYGEYEEYSLNISSSNNGGGASATFTSYSWSDGTSVVSTAASFTPTVTTTTTYTATIGYNGAFLTSTPVTVTASTVPTAPTTTDSAHCGSAIPTAAAADPNGFTSPTYKWYSASTGGTLLQTSTSTTYLTALATPGVTTFYVSVTNPASGCESTRTAINITVSAPEDFSIAAPTTACINTAFTATASNIFGSYTSYTWSASPAAGSGIPTTLSGASQSITPTAAGTYTYTISAYDGSCTKVQTFAVTVNSLPVISSYAATPATICNGGAISTLSAVVPSSGYTFATSTGASLNAMSGATTVLTTSNDDTVTASPASIGFNFVFNGTTYTQYSLSPDGWILLGAATASNEFTNVVTSTTNVPRLYPYWDDLATGTDGSVKTLVTGTAPNRIFIVEWNVTIPRNTTGASNSKMQAWLYEGTNVIEYRYGTMGAQTSNSISAGYTVNATTFNSITFATNTASTTTANDANTSVPASGRMYSFTPIIPSNVTWTSSTGTIYSNTGATTTYVPGTNTATVYVTPSTTTVYTATATSIATGCVATQDITVTVNPKPTVVTASNSAQCGAGTPTASVTDPNAFTTPTINWYAAATGGTPLQSGTDATYLYSVAATTTFYVSIINPTSGCESDRTPVTVTVDTAPSATIAYTASPYCATASPASVSLTGTTGGTFSADAALSINASTGAITPTTSTPGTYTITYTMNGASCGNPTATTSVTINAAPTSGFSYAAATYCTSGGTVTPTITGTAGTFTVSPSGLTIDPTTGVITLASSAAGTYDVTNTVAVAGCSDSITTVTGITINAAVAITTQPSSASVLPLANPSFSVAATGTGTLTYQWEVSTNGGSSWSPLSNGGFYSGVTSSTLNLSSVIAGMNTYQYHVIVTGTSPCSTLTSDPAILTVTDISITTQPQSQTICSTGGTVTFTVATTGGTPYAYQWQTRTSSSASWSDISGATTDTYTIASGLTSANTGNQFQCLINAGYVTSNIATLTVNDAVAITTQPSNQTACSNAASASFSIATSGTGVTYQWEEKAPAGAWTTLAGQTSATLTLAAPTFGMNGYQYRAQVYGASPCGNTTSNVATLTMIQIAAVTAQPSNTTVCSSATANFSVTATNATGYLWFVNDGTTEVALTDGTSSLAGATVSGATTASLSIATPAFALNGYTVRCQILSASPCAAQFSNTATLSVTATSGTIVVGTGATAQYATLTAAINAIIACGGISSPTVLEMNTGYNPASETYPLVLPAITGQSATNTITIREATGVTGKILSSAAASATVNLTGGKYWIIDGRSGGTGSTKDLRIENTNVGGIAVQFVNDASFNVLNYLDVRGVTTSATSGVVVFAGSTGTTGNDSNLISNSDIRDGVTNPTNAIYSAGQSGTILNDTNSLVNNSIYNNFSATLVTTGVLVGANNTAWTITGNKLFQSATRIFTTANIHSGINVTSGSGYTISDNVIGYANASGTGTTNMVGNSVALTGTFPTSFATTGTSNATRFVAINAAFTAAGTVSSIQNNTISGLALYTSSTAATTNGILCGINVTSGNATIGTVTGNTIGATSGASKIYTATTGTGGAVVGIYATSANTVSIQNNTIGGIDASGTSASISGSVIGIDIAGAGNFDVTSNVIGNTTAGNIRTGYFLTTSNLTNATGTATSTTGSSAIIGVRSATTGNTLAINSNTFRGWAVGGTATTVTGITSSGTMTGTTPSSNINFNLLGTSGLGWVTYSFANSGALAGIASSNTVATVNNIKNNDFTGIIHSVAGSSAHTYINLTGATAVNNIATIDTNTFTNLNVNTTGAVIFISHGYSIPTTGQLIINNNSIVTGYTRASAGAITITTSNSTSGTGSINNYTNNNFSNITVPDNASSTILGFNNTDGGTGSAKTVTGNTFNNWNGGTSGTTGTSSTINCMNFTYWNGASSSLSNNTITNITGRSTITGVTIGSASSAATLLTISGNTITGLTSFGTGGAVTGIVSSNISTAINITGNTIGTLSSTSTPVIGINITGATADNVYSNTISSLSSSSASGIVQGIVVSSGTAVNVYQNTIKTLSGSGASSPVVSGIVVSGGTTIKVYRNKVYDLAQSAAIATATGVNGMLFSAGTTVSAYNNIIGDLRTPAASFADAIRGMSVTSTTGSTSYNLYNNTIYLNASSTGTTFGTTGIYHTTSATATTAKLDLQNNIVINTSTPGSTAGVVTALRRSAAAVLGNYATTSNRNMYFAGTPSTTHTILYDGTNTYYNFTAGTAGTLFQTAVSTREANSFTDTAFSAGTFFTATAGTSSTFLQPNAVTTQAESGGANLAAVFTDDFNGITRGSLYDMGAWEFAGTTPAPAIAITSATPALSAQCTASSRVLVLDISTPSGSITSAKITYNNGAAVGPLDLTYTSGTSYTYTIPAASPANTTVTWSVTAVNSAGLSTTLTGTSYSDAPNTGTTVVASASVATVCQGSPSTLSVAIGSSTAAPAATSYCASTHASGCSGDNIARVVLNTLDKTTSTTCGSTSAAYSNFSGNTGTDTTTLSKGTTYPLSLTFGTDGNQYFGAWIDYNHDGTYSASEFLGASANAGASGTIAVNFTVPATALNGLTHIRIVGGNDSAVTSAQACGASSSGFGETQDYDVTIVPSSVAYSWSDGTSVVSTASSFAPTPSVNTTYTCTTTLNSCDIVSNSVTVTVNPTSVGGTIAGATSVCSGTNSTTLTLSGNVGTITKWQSSTVSDFSSSVTDIANTTTSLIATNLTATTYYRAVVTSGICSAANSNIVAVTVDPTSVGGTASSNQVICAGATPAAITLTGNVGSVVKWQSATDSAFTSPSDISNTTTTLSPGALITDTWYRAVIQSGTCGTVNSSAVHITVSSISVGGTVSSDQTICYNSQPATMNATGYTGAVVNWQSATDAAFTSPTDIPSSAVNALTGTLVGNLTATTYFRAVVQSGVCSSTVSSNYVTVLINSASVGGSATGDQSICTGTTPADLGLTGNTGTIVKWQKSTDITFATGVSDIANTTTVLSGAEIGVLTASTGSVNYYFRAVVKNGVCSQAYSAPATVIVNTLSVGGTVSSNETVGYNTIPTDLTLSGNNGAVLYWEKAAASSFASATTIAVTSNTLTGTQIGTLTTNTYFRAVVQNGSCSAVNSSYVLITVDPQSEGGAVASNQTLCSGLEPADLTLSGYSSTIIGWQKSTDDTFATGVSSIVNTSSTLTGAEIGALYTTTHFRAIVQNGISPVAYSSHATITVNPSSVGGSVTSVGGNPQVVCLGSEIYDLTVSGYAGSIIKWQKATDASFTTPVDIASSSVATLTTAAMGAITATTYFRAVVQNGTCVVAYSEVAEVNVSQPTVGGTVSGDQTICTGSQPSELSLTGETGNVIKWQSASDTSFTSPADIMSTSTHLAGASIGSLTSTTYFRAVVQSGLCSSAYSTNYVTITITPTSVGGSVSSNQSICPGGSVSDVTLSGNTGSVVKWQKATNTSFTSPTDIATTSTTLTGTIIGSLSTTTYFRAVVQNGDCSPSNSSYVTITVNPASVGGTVASAQTICSGTAPSDLTLTGNSGSVVKWQKAADASFTIPTDIASTATTLSGVTIGAISGSTYFRAVVQNGSCAVAYSSSVLITVDTPSVGGTTNGTQTICSGSQPSSLTLTGNTGTVVKWQASSDSGFSVPSDIVSTSTTLTGAEIGSLTDTTYFRAVVQNGSCSVSYSDPVLVTVNFTSVGGTVSTDQSICSGSSPDSLTLTGQTGNVVKWQKASDSSFTSPIDIASTATTLSGTTIGTITTTTYFRAVVQSGTCTATYSSVVTISVNSPSVGGTVSADQSICAGNTPTAITVTGYNGSVVKWQSDSSNEFTAPTDINITSATLAAIDMGTLTTTTYFRAVVQNGPCSEAYSSNIVTITVSSAPNAGTASADQAICSGFAPDDIKLVGYTGAIVKWQKSTSIDFSSVTDINTSSSTLSGATIGNLTTTTYFRAIVHSGSCSDAVSNVVTVSIGSTTWDGTSWSNGAPTSTTGAVMSGNYSSAGNFIACSLNVTNNAVVTFNSGDNITLNGALTVDTGSTFTLSNNSNLLQLTDVQNTGNIVVKRNSAALKRSDYIIWSSPLTGSQSLFAYSPQTLSNRFYNYNIATNLYNAISDPSAVTFAKGAGYLIRVPNNHPTTATIWSGEFNSGTPNNGPVSVTTTYQSTTQKYNMIGNPYPSTLSADAFIAANTSNIEGTLYFWRRTNLAGGSAYCTYNSSTGYGTTTETGITPSNVIQVGQGFFVAAKNSNGVTFNNTMRTANNGNLILRNAATVERNPFWLNLTGATGGFSQTLVNYMTGATYANDGDLESKYINDSPFALTSLINNEEFTIQSRTVPFDVTDVVPLNFKSDVSGTFTIALDHFAGLFAGSQDILLRDHTTNNIQNLKNGSYTFDAPAGTFSSRFDIIYQDAALNTNSTTFNENSVVVYKNNGTVYINSGSVTMDNVKIFDIRGRLVIEKKKVNATQTSIDTSALPNQVLIVQITSDTQSKVSKKVVN